MDAPLARIWQWDANAPERPAPLAGRIFERWVEPAARLVVVFEFVASRGEDLRSMAGARGRFFGGWVGGFGVMRQWSRMKLHRAVVSVLIGVLVVIEIRSSRLDGNFTLSSFMVQLAQFCLWFLLSYFLFQVSLTLGKDWHLENNGWQW